MVAPLASSTDPKEMYVEETEVDEGVSELVETSDGKLVEMEFDVATVAVVIAEVVAGRTTDIPDEAAHKVVTISVTPSITVV